MRLISAVLGTDSEDGRDANTLALLDYGFDRFRVRSPVRRGQVLARLPVRDRPGIRVPVRAGRGYRGVLARGAVVRLRLRLPRRLAGPLPAGTVVGAATVLAAGRDGGRARRLATVPVVLRRRLPAVSRLVRAGHFITRTATLAVIAALAALALAGLVVRGRVPSRRPRGTMR